MILVVWLRFFACFAQFLFASRGIAVNKVSTGQKKQGYFSEKVPLFCEKVVDFCLKAPHFFVRTVRRGGNIGAFWPVIVNTSREMQAKDNPHFSPWR